MPSYALAYRLRIRNASTAANPNGTADALTFTSVRGGTNPYIAEPPVGDGQSIDPLTGEFVAGAYTVMIADAITGSDGTGTLRLITNALEDATYRQQLLSRRAYLELSEDGGSTWTRTLVAGYVNVVELTDAMHFTFTIGDARRIEQNHRVFTWSNVPGPLEIAERDVFPQRGCLIGGPVIDGLGPLEDQGGWAFTVAASEADPADATLRFLRLTFVEGYAPPFFRRTRDRQVLEEFADLVLSGYSQPYTGLLNFSATDFDPLENETSYHPDLTVLLTNGSGSWSGTLFSFGNGRWFVRLDAASSALSAPTGGVRLRIITTEVSEASPLYVDRHPVDIVTDLWDTVGIAWDATTAAAVKAALGETLRYTVRITEPPNMAEFLARSVFGPFGFGTRNGADGERELFLSRRFGTTAPAQTIATADVPDDDVPPIFSLDERTVVTAFRITYQSLTTVNLPSLIRTARRRGTWPPDGVEAKPVTVITENADTTTFSTREVAYTLPGMVRDAASFSPAMAPLIDAITQEGFDRYGRGAIRGEAVVLRGTSAATLAIGDEVNVDLAHLPSRGYRLGESSIAARIMQILQRTELPEGARFMLLDSGVDLQPVTPLPTISAAAAGANSRTLAAFTITNAATINATGVLIVAVEWATGSSAPSGNGQLYKRFAPGTIPTGGIPLPPVEPGSTVHVRARTEQPFRRASAWSSWASHALTSFSAPTSVANGTLTEGSAELTWTPAAGAFPVAIYLYPGAAAPGSGTAADWAPYRVQVLPGGSSRTTFRGLAAAMAYTAGVAHLDPATGAVTAIVTDGFTTSSNTTTAPDLVGFAAIDCAEDAGYRTGVALAIYAANAQHDIVIQRAPDSSGSPGTWAELVRLAGGSQVYVDEVASDGATWWYRARHEVPGLDASAWTDSVEAVAGGVPDDLALPAPVNASLEVEVEVTDEEFIITWSGSAVELKIDNGFFGTPPTSPITVGRGAVSGGFDVPYTFRSRGTLGDTKTETIVVLKKPYFVIGGSDPTVDSVSYANGDTPGDGGGSVDISWTTSNEPVGATFDVDWLVTGGDPISSGGGTEIGVTSGFTLNAPLGNAATLRARVMMRSSGGDLLAEMTIDSAVPI